ncbi:MAG: GNAT family N-acetyltransferase [Anaerolineae bacterium]
MDFQIRPAQASDAAALTALIMDIGWFQHHFEGLSGEAAQERIGRMLSLALADSSHSLYVAEDSAQVIVGYVSVHWLPYLFFSGPEGFVSELFIREAARGQSVGKQLLETVKTEAVERGCARLSLINMRQRESYQRGFYQQCDWEERPEAANFVLRLR